MWIAIKSRFGGNDESKKMQKYILKQQFEGFTVSNSDGIHKGYERFQSLLSQLEIHGAGVSTEDANQKFLRSLPSAWLQVSMIMRNKPGRTVLFNLDVPKLEHEDLDQVDAYELEENGLEMAKWQRSPKKNKQVPKRRLVENYSLMQKNTSELVFEPVVNESHVEVQPKVWSDAPIIEEHMTGNKTYLADYQDINGGPVAFGGSRGYITGKGKIQTGKLDFEDVSFVKELQHFNLFSVSQMCDKMNKIDEQVIELSQPPGFLQDPSLLRKYRQSGLKLCMGTSSSKSFVYVGYDIIYGSTKKLGVMRFEALMKSRFQMSPMKSLLSSWLTSSELKPMYTIETQKPLSNMKTLVDVDVSQVTPKARSHLTASQKNGLEPVCFNQQSDEHNLDSAYPKQITNARHITAKVAGKLVSISEASIRTDLLFDDANGIDTLPNQAIFDAIQLMGYEGDLTVLTFNKALYQPQMRVSRFNAKEIKLLKAKITKLKRKANPVLKHFTAYRREYQSNKDIKETSLQRKSQKVHIKSLSNKQRIEADRYLAEKLQDQEREQFLQ
ncbi:hypothetical protein Tco_1070691 [Tanacetum coccineum]|uniref:Retrovirus-related Pol polyprotein from transposon TNT 1-94-like beta-barrel domain-containing protein n=1 Tax=Tanacetum coccineum TaxID=301880 RepID=A0ABQ5HMF1_9ASTR